jgi:AcrR family transcriptional regulator
VAAVLQAAAELFGTLGYGGTTTNRIAERAGVSIGSLYQYFPDKAALLRALREHHHEEAHASLDAAMERLADPRVPLREALHELMLGLVRMHEDNPGLHRLLGETLPDEECDEAEETERYARAVEQILRTRPEVKVPDPGIAAYVVVRTVDSLMVWATHHAPEDFDRLPFVEESVRMLEGYLLGRTG